MPSLITPLISKKKQKQIDAINNSSLRLGDRVGVPKSKFGWSSPEDKKVTCVVTSLNPLMVIEEDYITQGRAVCIKEEDILYRDIWKAGENPFDERWKPITPIAYTLQSILFGLGLTREKSLYTVGGVEIAPMTWNPFVFSGGKKVFYQRDFVWKKKDNQLLVESIYQGIDCGKILVRNRGWRYNELLAKAGQTGMAWKDIVDGKQRLKAVVDFIDNKFPDLQGNYYADLSAYAQHRFTNNQLFSYAEMPEQTTDAEVIAQFLKLNFTGRPQSKQHIEFVKSIKL